MNVLITGHRGFVGRHFMTALADHDITAVDIVDGNDARDYFRSPNQSAQPFDLVIHLAAVVGGRAKIEGAPLDLAVDLSLDAEMFSWAIRTRPRKVVYFSSSAAYPTFMQSRRSLHGPLRECDIELDEIHAPDHLYGWAKLTGEVLAKHARTAGLDVLVVRPFSGYGEDQDLTYPWPSFITRARRRDDPFEVWGDGTQVRDFIHVDDVVSATLDAVEQRIEGPINLGTGFGISFNDLARTICTVAHYDPVIRHIPSAPVGVWRRVADPTKMLSFYSPKVGLLDAIERALAKVPA